LREGDLPTNRESASCIIDKSVATSREIEIYPIEETMNHPAAPLRTVCPLFPIARLAPVAEDVLFLEGIFRPLPGEREQSRAGDISGSTE
jgi:hypothetical protein